MTPKQEAFVREYLVDLNATQAAKRAGYRGNDITLGAVGAENLKKPQIAAAVAEAQAKRAKRVEVTQDYVLGNLVEILERCMQRAPVMVRRGREMVQAVDEEGRHVWAFNAKGAVMSATKLGEHLGLFKQVHEHGGKDGEPIRHAFDFGAIRDALRRSHGIGASVPSGGNGHAGSNGGVRHEGSAAAPASPPPSGG